MRVIVADPVCVQARFSGIHIFISDSSRTLLILREDNESIVIFQPGTLRVIPGEENRRKGYEQ